ncbi:hypothetical protein [Litoribacillus peritrichatus]|uniref:Uncharacterized protein n=1 Tax=Litoribacillus peritrichatus TaxID=718191 RepID=A0ABP7N629_9GAMM
MEPLLTKLNRSLKNRPNARKGVFVGSSILMVLLSWQLFLRDIFATEGATFYSPNKEYMLVVYHTFTPTISTAPGDGSFSQGFIRVYRGDKELHQINVSDTSNIIEPYIAWAGRIDKGINDDYGVFLEERFLILPSSPGVFGGNEIGP